MKKIVVANNNLDGNLMGGSFNSTINKTIFSLGDFSLTSNFDGPESVEVIPDIFGGFVTPITLETLNLGGWNEETQNKYSELSLNLDFRDLGSFVRFGSTKEYIRMCIERIILNYPFGIFMDGTYTNTIESYSYDGNSNTSSFIIPLGSIKNDSNINTVQNNETLINNNPLSNLYLNFESFYLSRIDDIDHGYDIIEYSGNTNVNDYISLKVSGNPFPDLIGDNGNIKYHIKPKAKYFNLFKLNLVDFEKHILSRRDGLDGFVFDIKIPEENESGEIVYVENTLIWPTTDGYNLDIKGSKYSNFLEVFQNIAILYDSIKTDIIYNMLVPKSLLKYDLTEDKKISKLLRLYGKQIDNIRVFVDSLVYIHNLSYDKINNVPDKLLNNLARTLGWRDLKIKSEDEFVNIVFNPGEIESDEIFFDNINIELWRRILINTIYFWKSKGTRQSIISILKMLGISDNFLDFNEYIYISENKINPNVVNLSLEDFPNNSLPYDKDGYPSVPRESEDFFFQISGVTDNGQTYLDEFRRVGFNINPVIDNKKIALLDDNYAEEYDVDNRLIINTKTIDLALDVSGFIEREIYDYELTVDYTANDLAFIARNNYINVSIDGTDDEFPLPSNYVYDVEEKISKLNVYLNGIALVEGDDFSIVGGNIVLIQPISVSDILRVTFVDGNTDNEIQLENDIIYQIAKITQGINSAIINLNEEPKGNVILKIGSEYSGGIILTERRFGSPFGDYEFLNPTRIRIINPDVVDFFIRDSNEPYILISYIREPTVSDVKINLRNEYIIFTGLLTNKIYKKIINGSERYVYRLNYKIPESINLKFIIDGITLKPYQGDPNWDYKINEEDRREVILNTNTLTIGSVLSAYYLVDDDLFSVIIPGLNERTTFVDYLYAIESNYIEASTRKTITDHSTGWYPLLFRYYVEYIIRGLLGDDNPLKTKYTTFSETFKFLRRQGMAISVFMGFVRQLLPATAILRREGVTVRNSGYTKQKFTYKRGISFNNNINHNNIDGGYIGDAGSEFKVQYIPEISNWIDGFTLSHYNVENDSGYLGEITNLMGEEVLCDEIFGIDSHLGDSMGFDGSWLGFYYKGKYLFIAKTPLRNNISWVDLYNSGVVFGVDGPGPYNSGINVSQNKSIIIKNPSSEFNNLSFKVRLLKGASTNPISGPQGNLINFNGEWDDLLPNLINGVWDSYSSSDLGVSSIPSGHSSWTQETFNTDICSEGCRLSRGVESLEDGYSFPMNNSDQYVAWRPVLELIEPWD